MAAASISDQLLREYNRQGLIPGPGESESDYLARAAYCLELRNRLQEETGHPFSGAELSEMASLHAVELYDISPMWVPIIYDNHKLSLWHGGCAWIFQSDDKSPLAALLQLRRSLREKESLYGFLDKREIITHEMCHVGRMAFEEPLFEELLAYRTSASAFRRWMGPIVKNSAESGIFVLLLFLVFAVDFFFLLMGSEEAFYRAMWLKMAPLGLALYGVFRLAKRHRQLQGCLNNLREVYGEESIASAVAYRLTDEEIILFSRSTPEEILAYAEEQKKASLRWKLIDRVYSSSLRS